MSKLKVGIYGSYNYGNFGDDLQAIIIGKRVLENGLTPIFFRLSSDIADKYGFETTESINELVYNSKFCLLGGGSNFQSGSSRLSKLWLDIEETCLELGKALEENNCNLYSISVGGDGSGKFAVFNYGRAQLLASKQFKGGTVRLEEDVELLNAYGKKAFYYPDILWLTHTYWPKSSLNEKKTYNIGVNLNIDRGYRRFVKSLIFLSKFLEIKLHFIRLHHPQYNLNYEWQPLRESKKIECLTYSDIDLFLGKVSELDVIISSKLHVGMVSFGYGCNFYSLGGAGKTISFLKSINLEENIIKITGRINSIINAWSLVSRRNNDQVRDFSDEISKANGHLKFIDKLCS